MSNTEYFIFIPFGSLDSAHVLTKESEAVELAREYVDQYITDHIYHHLPALLTESLERSFDVKVVRPSGEEMVLPYQEWLDQYYQNIQDSKKRDLKNEYAHYLELKAKYETE